MSFQKIASLLDRVNAKRVLLLCHQNADPDALCSAFALSKLLSRIRQGIETEIASPEGVSKLSKILVEKLKTGKGDVVRIRIDYDASEGNVKWLWKTLKIEFFKRTPDEEIGRTVDEALAELGKI